VKASISDIPHIVKLGRKFHKVCPWYGEVDYNPVDFADFLKLLIEGQGAVFISPNAMCGGMLSAPYFNASADIATELFWYAEKGEGEAVRREFEAWSISVGAEFIQMTCLADRREKAVRRLYARHGYAAKEVNLFKKVKHG